MKLPSHPRAASIYILEAWLNRGIYPDRLLEQVAEERSLVTEIVLGAVRRQRSLRWIMKQRVPRRPDSAAEAALMSGLYQIFFMQGIKEHAAANETVEGARIAFPRIQTGFINGVLRGALRDQTALRQGLEAQSPGIRYSHPDELVRRWGRQFGQLSMRKLCEWNNTPPSVVVRVLLSRIAAPAWRQRLADAGIDASPHPFDPDHYITLPRGFAVPDLPGYREGQFIVQDPSCGAAIGLMAAAPGEDILDACAAPGGKAIAMADAMQGLGRLMALDASAQRLPRLQENLARAAFLHTEARLGSVLAWPEEDAQARFDGILLDVPCSNTGVIRRRPDARWRFDAENLRGLNQTQRSLLDAASRLVKPGGRLVYSTCSLEEEENESLVSEWAARNPDFRLVRSVKVLPGKSETDGAYAARLERS